MGRTHPSLRRPARLRERTEPLDRRPPSRALCGVEGEKASVLLLGLNELSDDCWAVLETAGIRLVRVANVVGAVRALTDQAAQVVIADARWAPGADVVGARAARALVGADLTHRTSCARRWMPGQTT